MLSTERPLQFPVDVGIKVMTPNQVYEASLERKTPNDAKSIKYVVLGAGKTAMDTIVYLQTRMKIQADSIAWVIPNDVWIVNPDGGGDPWAWPRSLLKHNLDFDRAAEALEKNGKFVRIDKNIKPTRCRFPLVPRKELKMLQDIKTTIRRGRATAIRKDGTSVLVEFGDNKPAWKAFATADTCVFVHATCPGPFNDQGIDDLFVSEKHMTLNLLTAPPISSSMATLAKLEAARSKRTLDLEFARRLVLVSEGASEENVLDLEHSENDTLRALVRGLKLTGKLDTEPLKPIVTLAVVLAIMDNDPMVGYQWMKGNRLTFLSIPGYKSNVYEDMKQLCEEGDRMGFSKNELQMFELLAAKLKPLEGL